MKFRYNDPLQKRDGFDLLDEKGEVAQGTIVRVQGDITTVVFSFTTQTLEKMREQGAPVSTRLLGKIDDPIYGFDFTR